MSETFIRGPYDPPLKVGITFAAQGRTKQSFAEECDVNNVVKKYAQTGVLTHVNERQPTYGDFSNVLDYQAAVLQVAQAREDFMELPADIRNQFQNHPGLLLDFLADPKNTEEAQKMGLIPSEPEAKTMPTPVTDPVTPDPASAIQGGE